MNAFPNPTEPIFRMTQTLLQEGCKAARESPRHRIIQPIHRKQEASVQRMLNFLQPNTFVRAHVHPRPGQIELVQVIQGRIGFLIFEEDGTLRSTHDLSSGPTGLIDIEPGTWHSLVCLAPNSVILETKQGPYDASSDKTFASWSALEENPESAREEVERYRTLFSTTQAH